jgi:AAA domain
VTVDWETEDLAPTDLEKAEQLPDLHDFPEVTAQQILGHILAAEGDTGYMPGVSLEPVEDIAFLGTGDWCPVHSVGATVCLYGRQNVGKTTWLLDELVYLSAAGKAMVLYCCIDGAADMKTRVQAQADAVRANYSFGLPLLFRLEFINYDLGGRSDGWARLEQLAVKWAERFASLGAADGLPFVVVLETLSTALDGADENGTGTQRFIAGATRFVRQAGHPRTFIFTHHGDAKPRGHSSILGNTDRVLRMVARSNGVVSVFVPTGAAAKDRFGSQAREFARFKIKERKLERGVTTVVVAPVAEGKAPDEEAGPPASCPEPLRPAWLALDREGAAEGLDDADLNAVLQKLVSDKTASAEAIRKRRTRLREQLLAAGVVVEHGGVFRLAE